MIARTIVTGIIHAMDAAAEKGDFAAIERWHIVAILMRAHVPLFLQLLFASDPILS